MLNNVDRIIQEAIDNTVNNIKYPWGEELGNRGDTPKMPCKKPLINIHKKTLELVHKLMNNGNEMNPYEYNICGFDLDKGYILLKKTDEKTGKSITIKMNYDEKIIGKWTSPPSAAWLKRHKNETENS